MKFGMPLPNSIQNAPELNLGLELFYTGFLDLTSCRQTGMSLGPIPMLSILEYGMIHGIEGEQLDDFVWFVQRLDQKYLEWSRNRAKSK
ncbi:tail chaperonin [Bordetella phage MW2]|uniref:Tail chaperonin n=2 Tax=Vojvodinavirus TaxID=2733220 RepID=A0A2D0W979_9CAUD|nr:tail chaperonin [Bordetella phage MW2]APL99129.1 putative tail chaperonin [Bordetella phage LK3]APL99209.1 tail chaperonin [Bordetella phage MW2]